MIDRTLVDILLIAGAVSWWTTTLVYKSGPFGLIYKFRIWLSRLLVGNTPLGCNHCTSFWVGLAMISLYYGGGDAIRAFVSLFGIIGIAQALRGASGEWS